EHTKYLLFDSCVQPSHKYTDGAIREWVTGGKHSWGKSGLTRQRKQNQTHIHETDFQSKTGNITQRRVDVLNELTTFPRIIKTHLPVQFLPKSFWEQNSKIIYVARNAKDSAVSYFHFDRMNKVQPEPGSWESFLQRFMEGKMVFGSWYEHVRGWWEKKQTCSNILYLFYEDLIEDTEQELVRICSFLGLSPTTELKKQVTEKVQFDNMKNNKMVNGSVKEEMLTLLLISLFSGRVGDWNNHFTVQQDEQFNEDYKKKMKNTDLQFRTVL
uniref:Sulfotransferase n=1 Tax=Haplochromis burtoni TaxID=8153 RepID=A0A3Q2WHQ1_HAPBU